MRPHWSRTSRAGCRTRCKRAFVNLFLHVRTGIDPSPRSLRPTLPLSSLDSPYCFRPCFAAQSSVAGPVCRAPLLAQWTCRIAGDGPIDCEPRRFYDPAGESVFANSESVGAFKSWSASQSRSGASTPTPTYLPPEQDPTALRVETSDGHIYVHSLATPRFAQGKRVRYAVWEYENLIDSSEIEPSDWIRIASDIERNYHAFDGFLILHGTDTLAFTASALSFLLVRRTPSHASI